MNGSSHIGLATAVRISNVWLLDDGEGHRFLIDSGHRLERRSLERSLRSAGITRRGQLTAVLLTHRHSDHAGNARWLRERYGCPVICHAEDAAILSGERQPPRLSGRGASLPLDALCRVEDRFPARCTVDAVYDEGHWRWGFEVVQIGGHTEGTAVLLHEPTKTLFTGDALLAGVAVLRMQGELQLCKREFSLDADACRRAMLDYLAQGRDIETLCSGHGPMVREDLQHKLRRLMGNAPSVSPSPTLPA